MNLIISVLLTVIALVIPLEADGAVSGVGRSLYLDSSEVIDLLKRSISPELPAQVSIELTDLYTTSQVPRGSEARVYSNGSPIGTIRFDLIKRDQPSLRVSGNVTVKAFGRVAVTTAPIRHAETIDPVKFTFSRRDLTPLIQRGYFLEGTHPEKLRANGYIRPGTILCASNTQSPMAVERMQTVELIHRRGTLTVSATVTALESGRLNDWIRVRNPQTNRIVEARVSDVGVVTTR